MFAPKTLFWIAVAMVALSGPTISDAACVSYDNIPSPLPGNVPSLGVQANAIDAFGNYVELAPAASGGYVSFMVLLSVWAPYSEWPAFCAEGWHQAITLEIFEVAFDNGTAVTGALVWDDTRDFLVPWRPEASPNCTGGKWLDADSGLCFSGAAHLILFPLNGTALPAALVFSIAFSTETYGPAPFGTGGPYNSLNIGLTTAAPAVGADGESGTVFLDSPNAGTYGDGGPTGVFRITNGAAPYTPAVRFVNDECYPAVCA